MSSQEWSMVFYAGIAIGILSLGVRYAGVDRLHRLFLCVLFPVALQSILFGFAFTLTQGMPALGYLVAGFAVIAVVLGAIWATRSMRRQDERDILALAVSHLLRLALIPFALVLVIALIRAA